MENKITIGIADMKMAQREGMLITYALGSCIGICLYDQKIRLGALIHIMLPLNMDPDAENEGVQGCLPIPHYREDRRRGKDV